MNSMVSIEREAIESTYFGVMDIYEKKDIEYKDRTRQENVKVFEKVKCALSKKNPTYTNMNEQYGNLDYTYEIFTNPEIKIKSGSIIYVSQEGMNFKLENIGEPHIYPTHQEIICQRKDKA